MRAKHMQFYEEAFNRLITIVAPIYMESEQAKKDMSDSQHTPWEVCSPGRFTFRMFVLS